MQCDGAQCPISAHLLLSFCAQSGWDVPYQKRRPGALPPARPALPPPPRGGPRSEKILAGNSRHLDGARSALLVTRWICCEDGLKRSKGNMHIEQVSACFCPPSRGGSPCAALPAGGQARKQKNTRSRHNVDNEDHARGPRTRTTTGTTSTTGSRRRRSTARARARARARHKHEHEHRHEHGHEHKHEHERQQHLKPARPPCA